MQKMAAANHPLEAAIAEFRRGLLEGNGPATFEACMPSAIATYLRAQANLIAPSEWESAADTDALEQGECAPEYDSHDRQRYADYLCSLAGRLTGN